MLLVLAPQLGGGGLPKIILIRFTALLDIEQHLWQLTMLLVDNIPQKTIRLRVTVELLLDSP